MTRALPLLLLAALSMSGRSLRAQEMDVPVAVQVPLFRKVLSFNRRLDIKALGELVVVVVFQGGNRESVQVKDQVVRAFNALPDDDVRVRVFEADLDVERLGDALARHKPAAVYVTPVRAVAIRDIAGEAEAAHAVTLTGVPRYVAAGLVVSVRLLDQRPKLMLNVTAATAAGVEFSSDLLRLAQVTR
jgi:hypothetical protein